MILGVVSDTHNRLDNIEKIIDIFNSNKVDFVIHTGDITKADTLRKFSNLNCSLMGVYGNNDLLELDLNKTSEVVSKSGSPAIMKGIKANRPSSFISLNRAEMEDISKDRFFRKSPLKDI